MIYKRLIFIFALGVFLLAGCQGTAPGLEDSPDAEGHCSTSSGVWPPSSNSSGVSCDYPALTAYTATAIAPNKPEQFRGDFQLQVTLNQTMTVQFSDSIEGLSIKKYQINLFTKQFLPLPYSKNIYKKQLKGIYKFQPPLDSLTRLGEAKARQFNLKAFPNLNLWVQAELTNSIVLNYWKSDIEWNKSSGFTQAGTSTLHPYPLAKYNGFLKVPKSFPIDGVDSTVLFTMGGPWKIGVKKGERTINMPGFTDVALPMFLGQIIPEPSRSHFKIRLHPIILKKGLVDTLFVSGPPRLIGFKK